ncbi:MAG: DNA polymerase III subunit beta [Oscillospiraceae bacterium]|nr:DNA polymerase III subunit beta [Oscillospiraceae bacterium]
MKIIVNKEDMKSAVTKVIGAVSQKSAISAIEGILLKSFGNTLFLAGYDLEMGITATIPAKVLREGDVIFPAKLLLELLMKVDGDEISFDLDDKYMCIIESGKAEFRIMGIAADEFPDLPSLSIDNHFTLSQGELRDMINQTFFAIALTEQRPVHTGSKFDIKNGYFNLISVDGFRLAHCKRKIEDDGERSFVVPRKTLSELMKIISDDYDETISVNLSKKHIIFEIDNYTVISRLLEGDFLDYERAVPSTSTTNVRIQRRIFIECFERVAIVTEEKLINPVRLLFSDNRVQIECATAVGRIKESLPAEIDGPDIEIGFNNRYLLEALKNCRNDEVIICLNRPENPVKIVPPEGDDYTFLVLPMRLNKYEQ